jgi:co-chaperonin GroES (HSP10)
MTTLVRPDGKPAVSTDRLAPLQDAYVRAEERVLDPTKLPDELVARLPQPTGWRILILPYRGRAMTKGGIIRPDEVQERSALATVAGLVLAMGPDCYTDKEKFPGGPWCKKGDWILFGRYAGARFKLEDGEVRILNEDEIIATITDPEDILYV